MQIFAAALQQQSNIRYKSKLLNMSISGNSLQPVRNYHLFKRLAQQKEQYAFLYNNKTLFSKKSNGSSSTLVRNYLVGKKPIAVKFMEDLNIDELKEELKAKKMYESPEDNILINKIKEHIAKKCDQTINSLSEKDSKALKVIQLEHDFYYSQGYQILSPEEMTNEYWLEALNMNSKQQRLKFYIYTSKKETLKKKPNKKVKTIDPSKRMDSYEHGRIFHRIYDTTIARGWDYKLASAMVHGCPLVFDFDFAQHMRPQDISNTGKQITECYAINRKHESPFHLHFTNSPPNNPIYKSFQMKRLNQNDLDLATITEKSYLELFDKERLVYLSPDARNTINEFKPDDVYIVAAFNDQANPQPLTYAKAKQDGIRCAKLPLDEYMDWGFGRKVLTIDAMMNILLTFYKTKSWNEAFKHIPKRHLKKPNHQKPRPHRMKRQTRW